MQKTATKAAKKCFNRNMCATYVRNRQISARNTAVDEERLDFQEIMQVRRQV